MKAQVSMEYLLLFGFAALMTFPIIVLFFTQSQDMNDDVANAQIDRVLREIVDAADTVYYTGEPARKTVKVYMPKHVESVIVNRNYIQANITSGRGTFSVTKSSAANLTGTLTSTVGVHIVKVEAQSNQVNITDR